MKEIADRIGFRYQEMAPFPANGVCGGLNNVLRTLEQVTGTGNVYSGILLLGEHEQFLP